MRMMLATACSLLLLGAASADDSKPAPKKPGKASPLDAIEGYERHTIEGFTLLISKEVTAADTSRYERKPLDVLELELKAVSRMMTPRALRMLQKLLIWVEWDEDLEVTNGRPGQAVAVYYGGHQLSLLQRGMHPLKSKSVTVLKMKSLTAEHQPKNDSGRCVLLHEIAHAVHDNLLDRGNPMIKAAYRQAMERKLYDKSQYVSTNEMEFFAELTCAYFDQLEYFPRTREELRKHDPASFKALDTVWGAAARKADPDMMAIKPKGLSDSNGSNQFDLSVTLDDVQFGATVRGTVVSADELSGKVVLLGFWGGDEVAVLRKLAEIHEELSPHGLRVIAGPAYVSQQGGVEKELASRDVPFTGVDRLLVRVKGTDMLRSEKPPHALIFGADGACVFRGSGYDALPHARAAVGRAVLASLMRGELPEELADVAESLTGGDALLEVVPKLAPLTTSKDSETAAAAKALQEALLAPGLESLARAQNLAKSDPVAAFLLAEPLTARFKGTPVASKASALLVSVRQTNAVRAELRARLMLDRVKNLDATLSGQAGSFDPVDPRFQARNAPLLRQMQSLLGQMRKLHPKARATEEAEKIAKSYGVS